MRRPARCQSPVQQAHARQKILSVLLSLPIDKWIQYSIEDLEEAFPRRIDRLAPLARARQELQPVTTTDQIATICAREGLRFDVDPITERHTFKRRRVPCPACEAMGSIYMVDVDRSPPPFDGHPSEPTICGMLVTCIRCKGDATVAAPREPNAMIVDGERLR